MDQLRRTAYLLCGDWHTADDLVSTALVKLLRHWSRVSAMETIDAYARRVLLRARPGCAGALRSPGPRRRPRLRYARGPTAGALARVVGAVAAPPALAPSGGLGAGGPGAPPVCPQVTPTTTARPDRTGEPGLPDEPCGTAAGRLTGALDASLRAVLPGWTATNDEHPSGPVRFARQAPDAAPDGYLADVDVRRGAQFHIVLVQLSVHGDARTAGERGEIGRASCRERV